MVWYVDGRLALSKTAPGWYGIRSNGLAAFARTRWLPFANQMSILGFYDAPGQKKKGRLLVGPSRARLTVD